MRFAACALVVLTAVLALGNASQSAPGSTKSALAAYLKAVDQARQPYRIAGPVMDTALNGLHNSPDATWVNAAQKVRASQHAAEHLAAAVQSLKAPSGLQKANGQLHQAAVLAAQYLKKVGSDLAAKNVAKVQAVFAEAAQLAKSVNGLNASWKAAVIAAAAKVGLKVPAWVGTFGNG